MEVLSKVLDKIYGSKERTWVWLKEEQKKYKKVKKVKHYKKLYNPVSMKYVSKVKYVCFLWLYAFQPLKRGSSTSSPVYN